MIEMVLHIPVTYKIESQEVAFEIEQCDGCFVFAPIDDLEIVVSAFVGGLSFACEQCIEDFNLSSYILK
jgi:hypothetical protein